MGMSLKLTVNSVTHKTARLREVYGYFQNLTVLILAVSSLLYADQTNCEQFWASYLMRERFKSDQWKRRSFLSQGPPVSRGVCKTSMNSYTRELTPKFDFYNTQRKHYFLFVHKEWKEPHDAVILTDFRSNDNLFGDKQ